MANNNRPRIVGFGDLPSNAQDPNKQTYYAGGEKSGTAIQFPDQPGSGQSLVSNLFSQRRAQPTFDGSAYRLGNTEGTYKPPQQQHQQSQQPQQQRRVTFWRSGFTVDNSAVLRRYDDPANNSFLEDINKGLVPLELQTSDERGTVDFLLEDKRGEDFKPPQAPQPQMQSFSGTGNVLGGGQTTIATLPVAAPAPAPTVAVVDQTKPMTNVQVRFMDGSKATFKVNPTNTIGDLYSLVSGARGNQPRNYKLAMGVPPFQPLTTMETTIAEAGISNSVVLQKSL